MRANITPAGCCRLKRAPFSPIFRLHVGASAVVALFLTGCSGPSLPAGADTTSWNDFLVSGAIQRLPADWDDIDAAVMVGAARSEMAVAAANPGPSLGGGVGDPTQRLFELKTIRDEPAWLMITRAPDSHDTELVMRAKVGRFGDEKREKDLLREVAARLEQLRGRAVAPLPR